MGSRRAEFQESGRMFECATDQRDIQLVCYHVQSIDGFDAFKRFHDIKGTIEINRSEGALMCYLFAEAIRTGDVPAR